MLVRKAKKREVFFVTAVKNALYYELYFVDDDDMVTYELYAIDEQSNNDPIRSYMLSKCKGLINLSLENNALTELIRLFCLSPVLLVTADQMIVDVVELIESQRHSNKRRVAKQFIKQALELS